MKKNICAGSYIAIFTIFISTSSYVSAEGACPPGHYQTTPPGSQGPIGCAPIPGTSKPVKWSDRWGAIATDGKGNWGIVSDMPNKDSAEREAVYECHQRKGFNCKPSMSYVNQCAAVVSTRKNSGVARAPTEAEAISDATSICEKESRDLKCAVFYSGCSNAVRAN